MGGAVAEIVEARHRLGASGPRPTVERSTPTLSSSLPAVTDSAGEATPAALAMTAVHTAGSPPPDPGLSRASLAHLQRTAGNSAVAAMLDPRRRGAPPSPGGGARPLQRQHVPPATPTTTPPATTPVGSGGALGEVEIDLPTVNIADRQDKPKHWEKRIAGAKVLDIPIPEIPVVSVGIAAEGRAFADFNAWFGPVQLRNIRVGMSKQQAVILAAGALSPLAPVAGAAVLPLSPAAGLAIGVLGGAAARIAALATLYKGPFKARAEIAAPAGGRVRFGVGASLAVDAELARKYSIASLGAGVEGAVELELKVEPQQGPAYVDITYENGDLSFLRVIDLAANLQMQLMLNAFIRAQLLGKWDWYRSWNLTKTPIDATWPLSPSLKVENKRGGGGPALRPGGNPVANSILGSITDTVVEFVLSRDGKDPSEADAADFLQQGMRKALTDKEEKKPLPQGPGGPTARRAPVGSREDPILMSWYKPLHWYLDPIHLDVGNGREEFRRTNRRMLPNHQMIGVPSSTWPSIGKTFQIPGVPTPRSGTEQDAFRETLQRYGFSWHGWDADHVVDLGLSGYDTFDNLWPLEAGVNRRAGNWQLGQSVRYNRPDDPPEQGPRELAIKNNPDLANKWFRIRDFQEPR
jgi:hypothetical protein